LYDFLADADNECCSNLKVYSDNMAVVEIINKQTCKDKVLMRLVRRLVIAALTYNIVSLGSWNTGLKK
jgi:hypothetical protein